jgi:hypothetical protein
MTRRYFYTDPLAAAWMKHYGMVFRENDEGWVDPLMDKRDRYIICSDSLHLLEPQVGDLLHIVRGFCSYYKTVESISTGGVWSDGEHWDIATKEPLHDWEIIQRNGIAFMWPEEEV